MKILNLKNNYFFKRIFIFIFLFIFLIPNFSLAADINENRNYFYEFIDITAQINEDSTVDITEKQTFNYSGQYNKGWRSISLKKIDHISDIKIVNGETGEALVYNKFILEKNDPNSWGKYSVYQEGRNLNIEWYYNLSDTKQDWIISYKVHGAIGFYKDYDEFYWNLFTDYDVPVISSKINVLLPKNVDNLSNLKYQVFSSSFSSNDVDNFLIEPRLDGVSFSFLKEMKPKSSLTVFLDWPKGFVNQHSYYLDFLNSFWKLILAILIIFLSIIGAFFYWYFKEKYPLKKMTIVPQYEPPQFLPPAMAEVIIKEKISKDSWPATVVDLAIRGYLKIEEITIKKSRVLFRQFLIIFMFLLFLLFLLFIFYTNTNFTFKIGTTSILIFLMIALNIKDIIYLFTKSLNSKNYKLVKNDKNTNDLKEYEKIFLNSIFKKKDFFLIENYRKFSFSFAIEDKQDIFDGIKKSEKALFDELNKTGLYSVAIKSKFNSKYNFLQIIVLFYVLFLFLFIFSVFVLKLDKQSFYLLFSFVCAFFIFINSKFNPRLNKKGLKTKTDWLGFKMYLEKAEKYRMQDLTPEIFEKYLPYAMILGVEKKWANNFKKINLPQPNWYYSILPMSSLALHNSFDPFSFTDSFSSSFSSSFNGFLGNNSNGGAGGGGGGAGGGSGGGGGGAS